LVRRDGIELTNVKDPSWIHSNSEGNRGGRWQRDSCWSERRGPCRSTMCNGLCLCLLDCTKITDLKNIRTFE
jgi:hypothetical protein